jgi:translation elongation factor EF-1alpha
MIQVTHKFMTNHMIILFCDSIRTVNPIAVNAQAFFFCHMASFAARVVSIVSLTPKGTKDKIDNAVGIANGDSAIVVFQTEKRVYVEPCTNCFVFSTESTTINHLYIDRYCLSCSWSICCSFTW